MCCRLRFPYRAHFKQIGELRNKSLPRATAFIYYSSLITSQHPTHFKISSSTLLLKSSNNSNKHTALSLTHSELIQAKGIARWASTAPSRSRKVPTFQNQRVGTFHSFNLHPTSRTVINNRNKNHNNLNPVWNPQIHPPPLHLNPQHRQPTMR